MDRPTLTERALRQKGYEHVSRVPMVFAYRERKEQDVTVLYIEDMRKQNTYFCCYCGLTKYIEDLDFFKINEDESFCEI